MSMWIQLSLVRRERDSERARADKAEARVKELTKLCIRQAGIYKITLRTMANEKELLKIDGVVIPDSLYVHVDCIGTRKHNKDVMLDIFTKHHESDPRGNIQIMLDKHQLITLINKCDIALHQIIKNEESHNHAT